MLGVVVQACDPGTQEVEAENSQFKVILEYSEFEACRDMWKPATKQKTKAKNQPANKTTAKKQTKKSYYVKNYSVN